MSEHDYVMHLPLIQGEVDKYAWLTWSIGKGFCKLYIQYAMAWVFSALAIHFDKTPFLLP